MILQKQLNVLQNHFFHSLLSLSLFLLFVVLSKIEKKKKKKRVGGVVFQLPKNLTFPNSDVLFVDLKTQQKIKNQKEIKIKEKERDN